MNILSFSRFLVFVIIILSACKKSEVSESKPPSMRLNLDSTLLANDSFFGTRLEVFLENTDTSLINQVEWRVDNPRIAVIDERAVVWPRGAGITYVYARIPSLNIEAKCKVIVTDGNDYKFRLILKDKGIPDHSLSDPSTYLSEKAISRRRRFNIPINESDLPISSKYIEDIERVGGEVVAKSKWLGTVCVSVQDQFLVDQFKALPFVKDVVLVYMGKRKVLTDNYVDQPRNSLVGKMPDVIDYGSAKQNIGISNGEVLHEGGFKGMGIDIAVIDAGFLNLPRINTLSDISVKGAKSFVYENSDPYSVDSHGVSVLSCMAARRSGTHVGTAPEASYWLLRTEDASTEYPVEEDYWVSAAEFADSAGVDIINSSLGYDEFYYPLKDYSYSAQDMDGKTAYISRAANMAFSKGMIVVNSADNNQRWVGSPADSPGVLTVGSVNASRLIGYDSSWGITADGRMKPDVMALGQAVATIDTLGRLEIRGGTSFASPIIAGLVACLWQAYPSLSNKELMDVIRNSGNHAAKPVLPFGYGIADMKKAMILAEDKVNRKIK